jgi:hypothetical protein
MNAKRARTMSRFAVTSTCLGILLWASSSLADEAGAPEVQACVDAYQSTQELRLSGKIRLAREKAAVCAADVCPAAVRSGCTKWLRELIDSQPSLVVLARDGERDVADAEVYVDGERASATLSGRPIEVDPGKHVVKLVRRGRAPIERVVVVAEGTKLREVQIDLAAPNKPPPRPSLAPAPRRGAPVGGIVAGGLAVGFVGTFAVLAFSGARDLDRMHDTCGLARTCLDSDVRAVRVKLVTGDAFLAASIVSLGVGVGLTIRHYSTDPESRPSPVRLSIAPTPGGAFALASLLY